MTSPSLAFQTALRTRLVGSSVTTLVPAAAIFDRPGRPEALPSIVLGDDQEVDDAAPIARDRTTVYSTLHIWSRGGGSVGPKQIAGAIRTALASDIWSVTGYHVVDLMVQSVRYLRDPDGETDHGVLTIETTLEVSP